jgi:hypothetical protein
VLGERGIAINDRRSRILTVVADDVSIKEQERELGELGEVIRARNPQRLPISWAATR